MRFKNIIAEFGSANDMAGRTGLAALLGQIERGEVKTVVVKSLDRLTQNAADAEILMRMFAESGVRVITTTNGIG